MTKTVEEQVEALLEPLMQSGLRTPRHIVYQRLKENLVEVLTKPIPMILHCPHCRAQHIDQSEPCDFGAKCQEAGVCYAAAHNEPERCTAWNNPPHKSHLCDNCGTIWRPADVATTGVEKIETKGKADTWEP